MRWNVVIKHIDGGQAVILFEGREEVGIPVRYLPSGCRVGDVLKIDISFCPFETIESLLDRTNNT
jgi:hypothetical protein